MIYISKSLPNNFHLSRGSGGNFFWDIFKIMALDVLATYIESAKIDIRLEAFQWLITRIQEDKYNVAIVKMRRVQLNLILLSRRNKQNYSQHIVSLNPDLYCSCF